MAQAKKTILVIAQHNKPEALRMAAGLTLLDDEVHVTALGGLDDDSETALQLEALEFAEVPVDSINPATDSGIDELADAILWADVVYVV
jgi:predicted protein tyrosine phosphatase